MDISTITFDFISEDALLLLWPEKICRSQHQQILATQQVLTENLPQYLTDSITSFNSLLIYYRYQQLSAPQLKNLILQELSQTSSIKDDHQKVFERLVTIPVYYGEEAALDIEEVMKTSGLTYQQVIELHSQTEYRAYALGFTPGFCYLASLPSQLQMPRKTAPRQHVPAGAVALAGEQTAVYPDASPGGWHIIGVSPMPMYEVTESGLETRLQVGDKVRFKPIDKTRFLALGGTFDSLTQ